MRVTKRQRGIPDWDAKRAVIKELVGGFTETDAVERVCASRPELLRRLISITDWYRKRDKHYPVSHGEFFDALARMLGCAAEITGASIVNATISEFIEMLPKALRERAHKAASGGAMSAQAIETKPTAAMQTINHGQMDVAALSTRIIHLHHTDEVQSISAGVRAGILDTRHYYSSACSVETWRRLVSADAYPTYDQCKAGLWKLMHETAWREAIASAAPTTAVMLAGGGAPTKDLVLARALLEQSIDAEQLITMVIVDISPYMLLQSEAFLSGAKRDLVEHRRISFEYRVADILKLGDPPPVFERDGSAVFAITGGTIGNIKEAQFFQSLDCIAKPGDMLIISADTVDDMPSAEIESMLKKKYNHGDMRRMIRPGVVAVLDEYGLSESADAALDRVDVRVRPSQLGVLTDIPEGWSVTAVLAAKQDEITLLSSTRYSARALAEFVARWRWEVVCKVPSPLNQHFVQFAFRRS